jgi:hypothetical protein
MTKARTNASATPAVGRNMVINGAMNVAQRSASVTGLGAAGGYFTVDRWKLNMAHTAGRLTMTQTADGPDGISANCIKLDCTTADTSIAANEYLILEQRFEGQNLQRMGKGLAGSKQVTVSFYVKANAAFTFGVELYDTDHNRQITKLYATTTDWVRHELTFPADVDGGDQPYEDDNAMSLLVDFWLHGGSNYTSGTLNSESWANVTAANFAAGIDSFFSSTDNNFFLTGVQMEVGPVATEFEQEDFGTTLQKCQRYFYRHGGAVGEAIGDMLPTNASAGAITVLNPVELRADPSVTILNLTVHDTATVHAVTAIQIRNDLSANRRFMYFVTTVGGGGMTGFRPMVAAIDGSSAGYLELDAEL